MSNRNTRFGFPIAVGIVAAAIMASTPASALRFKVEIVSVQRLFSALPSGASALFNQCVDQLCSGEGESRSCDPFLSNCCTGAVIDCHRLCGDRDCHNACDDAGSTCGGGFLVAKGEVPTSEPLDYNGDGYSDIAFHRPGGWWNTVPVLLSNGVGSWSWSNHPAPSWANQPGVVAIPGHYNQDDRTDVAFHRPGSTWNTVPVLLSRVDGTWEWANQPAPGWANGSGVVAVADDYDGDGLGDIAFHRPGSTWKSVPVLLSRGDGSWEARNKSAPGWAHASDVVAVAGDYNGDSLGDIAFHRPGSSWSSVPVLFGRGDGSWEPRNESEPGWANLPDVVALAGDYNGDGLGDIAFHRPGSSWRTVPVLFGRGDGSWEPSNESEPGWANRPGVVALVGDYDGDGVSDIAFHRPGSSWATVPVLFANRDGSWTPTNQSAPSWANQPGVIALTGHFDDYGGMDIAFHRPGSGWASVPVLLSTGYGDWWWINHGVPSWANQPGAVAVDEHP